MWPVFAKLLGVESKIDDLPNLIGVKKILRGHVDAVGLTNVTLSQPVNKDKSFLFASWAKGNGGTTDDYVRPLHYNIVDNDTIFFNDYDSDGFGYVAEWQLIEFY